MTISGLVSTPLDPPALEDTGPEEVAVFAPGESFGSEASTPLLSPLVVVWLLFDVLL